MWGLTLKLLAGALLTLNSLLKWACMLNLMSIASAMAGFPYTTACSPSTTNLPGAEAVTVIIPIRTF